MIKSEESLEWVCDATIRDKKIPHIRNIYDPNFKPQQYNTIDHLQIVKRPPHNRKRLNELYIDDSPGYRKMITHAEEKITTETLNASPRIALNKSPTRMEGR